MGQVAFASTDQMSGEVGHPRLEGIHVTHASAASAVLLDLHESEVSGDLSTWREALIGSVPAVVAEVEAQSDGSLRLHTEIVGMSRLSAASMLRSLADEIEMVDFQQVLDGAGGRY